MNHLHRSWLRLGLNVAAGLTAVATFAAPTAALEHTLETKDPTTITSSWTGLRGALGTEAVATGHVGGTTRSGRVVRIVMSLPGGWREVARTTTASDGSYRVTMANSWLRDTTVATHVLATTRMSAALGTRVRSVVSPSWSPAGDASMHDLMGSGPGRYRLNPCRPHGWRLNDTAGTRLADAREGVRRLSQATGIRFVYLGRTTHDPAVTSGWPGPVNGIPTTLVLGFGPDSATKWDVGAGEAGPRALRHSRGPDGSGVTQIVATGAWINTTHVRDTGFGVGDHAGQVILHELGHTVGLLHAPSDPRSTQRMNFTNPEAAARWGAGDLAGLRAVGLHQGCVTEWAGATTTWMSARSVQH